ncbi:MAG: TolB family protein, partial [Candidatus Zixiibacteriota bacterium]
MNLHKRISGVGIALYLSLAVLILSESAYPANHSQLTIEQIMRGPEFVGRLPGMPHWSEDGTTLYFNWNPVNADDDSLYKVTLKSGAPEKVSLEERRDMPSVEGVYNSNRTERLYTKHGDIFLLNVKTQKALQITNTIEAERGAVFTGDEDGVVYHKNDNLYVWDRTSGVVTQITDFQAGKKPEEKTAKPKGERDERLQHEERRLMKTLARNLEKQERAEASRDSLRPERPRAVYTRKKKVGHAQLSPDARYVTFL